MIWVEKKLYFYCIALSVPKIGEGNGTPLQYSCLENPMDGGAWLAAVHGDAKSWTRLRDFTFTFHFHALEKEMATHSSVLAWRILGMGEPGWAAVYGVTQSRTRLKWLSSSSISLLLFLYSCILLLLFRSITETVKWQPLPLGLYKKMNLAKRAHVTKPFLGNSSDPVVRIPLFHCRGPEFNSWSRN